MRSISTLESYVCSVRYSKIITSQFSWSQCVLCTEVPLYYIIGLVYGNNNYADFEQLVRKVYWQNTFSGTEATSMSPHSPELTSVPLTNHYSTKFLSTVEPLIMVTPNKGHPSMKDTCFDLLVYIWYTIVCVHVHVCSYRMCVFCDYLHVCVCGPNAVWSRWK